MIFQDLQAARAAHYKAIQTQEQTANEVAEAQYALDVAEGAAIAALRAEGTQAALVPKLARSMETVAKARQALAVAEGVYKAAQSRTQATYLDWKLAADQYEREWVREGMR